MSKQLVERIVAIIVALANEKGGVGKTTLTAIFLAILSMLGYDVLGIDMDPQGHLGLIYGYHRDTLEEGIYDILWKYKRDELRLQAPIRRIIKPTFYDVSGKIFDPRRPHADRFESALRKVQRSQLETIIRNVTGGSLEGAMETSDPDLYATETWYTFQANIDAAIQEAKNKLAKQELPPDLSEEQENDITYASTGGRYTKEQWDDTQTRIDEAMWEVLQERINKARRGPDIVPITADAGNADYVLKGSHEYWGEQLHQALRPIASKYHYVFIDCPPSIQTLTINALNTANYVAIPLTPETLNLEGMLGLLGVIGQAQARANPHLKTAGIILNKLQPNWRSHKQQALGIRNWEQRENVFATEIKTNVSVVNSLDSQSLIVLDQPESEHARVYWYLLNDLLQVIGGPAQADVAAIVSKMREEDQKNEAKKQQAKQRKREQKAAATQASAAQE